MLELLLHIILSAASAIGFSLITNAPHRAAGIIGFTGALSWTAFWVLKTYAHVNILLANMIGALIIGLLAYHLSRKFKLPENIIYIPCLVNLVPGGNAYRTILYMVQNRFIASLEQAITTFLIAAFLAVGLFSAQYLISVVRGIIYFRKSKI